MPTIIKISDLMPVKHGEAVLHVASRLVRGPVPSHTGYVMVKFPQSPQANYTVPTEISRPHETDATADAIALRRELIEQNQIVKKEV